MDTLLVPVENIFDELISHCTVLVQTVNENPNTNTYNEEDAIRQDLDRLFSVDEWTCLSVSTTNNTDKNLFGVFVSPIMIQKDIISILFDDEIPQRFLKNYKLEIDSKLLSMVDGTELAAYLIEEVYSSMNTDTIETVRSILDRLLTNSDDCLSIVDSVNYFQVLTFGIKDTIRRIGSLIYKDKQNIGMNKYIVSLNLRDTLDTLSSKLNTEIYDDGEVSDCPKLGVLQWCLMTYKNVSVNCRLAEETLLEAKAFTGSLLEKAEIDKTIKAIRRAVNEVVSESVMQTVLEGFSLFANLKRNGLRSLEDDLYEFKLRAKNVADPDEASYVIRQMSTRMSILEDYLYNTQLSPAEYKRWNAVLQMYRELREEVSRKNLKNKSYGIYIDYNAIDKKYGE